MKIGAFDLDRDVLVVAEIGNNHEGNYGLAEDLIGKAAEAGAGAVKFQTYRTEHYISARDAERFARLKGFELTYDQFERLSRRARDAGLLFLSTPFDVESARFLGGIADGLKIASADNTFYPLLETVARTGKPIIISTGLASPEELRKAAELVEGTWHSLGIDQDLALLHCIAAYPAPTEQANLAAIQTLRESFQRTVGYSDHTIGIEAAALAVALGARIVEKHFTVDNNYSDFRDHQLSADPPTLKRLIERVREAEAMLGSGAIGVQECERAGAKAMRRSIAAARDLDAGTVLGADDLTWVRPGGKLPPGREELVVGRRLARRIAHGEAITLGDLEDAG